MCEKTLPAFLPLGLLSTDEMLSDCINPFEQNKASQGSQSDD